MQIWRDVVGYKGLFQVSDCGNVRSLDRRLTDGRLWRGRPLKAKRGEQGHLSVRLCDGKHVWRGIHCLVLEAFVGPCPDGMQGCHNDGNPANNLLSNLRWDTPKGNHADKRKHGTLLIGERNNLAKLTPANIITIRERARHGDLGKDIAADFGVTPSNISSILSGKTWGHIGG